MAATGHDVPLADLTTMRVGGSADIVVECHTAPEVAAACKDAKARGLELLVLGEGSNLIVTDEPVHRLVIRMRIPGYEHISEDDDSRTVRVGAGEHWDDVVARSVEEGLAGIEAMSMIPGTSGATPVQNAGAYGQEIADTLVNVEAYDRHEDEFVTLTKEECGFGYRNSAFKTSLKGRYVITALTLRLSKKAPKPPTYNSLKRYLAEHEITEPTVADIRDAVMKIRARILPDPSVVPNTGSFFKNPIVDEQTVERLRARYPDMPAFEHEEGYKLAAGWLMDQCGLKGTEYENFRFHDHHALVITNPHHGTYAQLAKVVAHVQAQVERKFGVRLEPEPEFI